MKYDRIWIVVADGARAQVFLNEGPGTGLKPALDHALVADNRPSGDISSDRPGRSFDSAGAGRHAMQPSSDPHRHAQTSFAHGIANLLEENYNNHKYEHIFIVAAPRMLGDLRAALGNNLKNQIVGEINKDLSKLTVPDLRIHLGDLIKL